MATTQKTLLLAIFANIVLLLAIGAYNGSIGELNGAITAFTGEVDTHTVVVNVEEQNLLQKATGTVTNFILNDVIDPFIFTMQILWIFLKSLLFSGVEGISSSSGIERFLLHMVDIFMKGLRLLLILEVFMLWRNRKASS